MLAAFKTLILLSMMLSLGYLGYNTHTRGGLDFRPVKNTFQLNQFESTVVNSPDNAQFMLIGDSHAMSLQAGLIRYFGNTVALSWGPACIPFYGVDRFDSRFSQGTCTRMMYEGFRRVEKNSSIKAVILHSMGPINLTGEVFNDPDISRIKGLGLTLEGRPEVKDFWEIYEIGMRDTFAKLNNLKKVTIFVIDVPELGFDPHVCLVNKRAIFKFNNKDVCAVSRVAYDERVAKYKTLVYKVANEFPDVVVIDPADALCDQKWCWAKKDGVILYHDIDHLSDSGSYLVGQLIRRSISARHSLVRVLGLSSAINEPIRFASDDQDNSSPALIAGWAKPEGWGVWSVGRKSSLIFSLPLSIINSSLNKNFALVLNAKALINNQHSSIAFNLVVNDGPPRLVTFDRMDQNEVTISITQDMVSAGFVNLDFTFLNPISPIEIGLSKDDDRLLGIGLKSATFY